MSTYQPYRPWVFQFPKYGNYHAIEALRELTDFIVIDLETSGIKKKGEAVEIAIVDYQTREPLIDTLLKPVDIENYKSSKAREIHGISQEELEKAPTLPDIWPMVLEIVQSKTLSSWNLPFDAPMLRYSAMKWGLQVPQLSGICIMRLFDAYANLDYWASLDEACQYFGIERQETHRALADVMDTIRCHSESCVKERKEKSSCKTDNTGIDSSLWKRSFL